MAEQFLHRQSGAEQFIHGLVEGTVQDPWQAMRQLGGQKIEQPSGNGSIAETIGRAAGFAIDTTLLSVLVSKPANSMLRLFGAGTDTMGASMLKFGLSGSIYGGLLTPSEPGQGLLTDRLKNAAIAGGSFALLGAAQIPRFERFEAPRAMEGRPAFPEEAPEPKFISFANGDKLAPLGDSGNAVRESLDGSKTYFLENGDWMWTHPDGTVIDGRKIAIEEPPPGEPRNLFEPEIPREEQYNVTTTLSDQSTIHGFPTGRQYIQEAPWELPFDRGEEASLQPDGSIVQRTANGDISRRWPNTGDEHVFFTNGGKAEHFGPGGSIYKGTDGSEFVGFSDGSWHWNHPDNIKVQGTADGAVTTTRADGTVEEGFPPEPNYIKQPYSREVYDNHRVTLFPDGSAINEAGGEPIIQRADGSWQNKDQYGTYTHYNSGARISEMSSGDRVYHFPEGDKIIFAHDGSVTENTDSHVSGISQDGHLFEQKLPVIEFGDWATYDQGDLKISEGPHGDWKSTSPDGTEELYLPDFGKATSHAGGGQLFEAPDGSRFGRFPDGGWQWTNNEGNVTVTGTSKYPLEMDAEGHPVYSGNRDHYDVVTQYTDGRKIEGWPQEDGMIVQPYARNMVNGARHTFLPNGTEIVESNDGTKAIMRPDQSTEIHGAGTVTTVFPGGDQMTHDARTGNVTYHFTDGGEVTYDAEGNVVHHTAPQA